MSYAKRIDANQHEIVETFRKMGASVWITSGIGQGGPDCVVGYRGVNVLVEIKDGKKFESQRNLTHSEALFHLHWAGRIVIIKSVEEAVELLNDPLFTGR